ncbi:MAG: site-2 protease family protein [Methanomassiliicoccales archaeon]|nr:MAG: site-2 protease family protein [Methanomassiliicoccales archaeon]
MRLNGVDVIQIPDGYGRVSFGRDEVRQIIISVIAMTAIFTILFYGTVVSWPDVGTYDGLMITVAISATAVILGFLIHELGHKAVAQRYGAWAEFRMYPMGFLLGFITAFLGFLFVAPGAVYIQGQITKKQYGQISLMGPMTNIIIGTVFLAIWLVIGSDSTLGLALNMLAVLSLFLAIFNLLPIPPLDGSKVVKWNIPVYIVVVIVTAILLMVAWEIITL